MAVDFAAEFFSLDAEFPPDACEQSCASLGNAVSQLRERRPDLFAVMNEIGQAYLDAFGGEYEVLLQRTLDALALSFVRMASRHGTWGDDLHEYHNEHHTLELLNGRLARIRLQLGWKALGARDWLLLALFATCHDLRQRESVAFWHEIGANERASIAEAFRILDSVGFSREQDRDFYLTLGLMIAGSTFDARPAALNPFNTAEVASSGGSLAPKLVAKLVSNDESEDPTVYRRTQLMLIAADLDTANVGEPFASLAGSAVRLVQEREKRAGRALSATESALPVFEFLTDGQDRYFFDLHRFVSALGNDVFGTAKQGNEARVREQSKRMREQFPNGPAPGQTGQQIIDAFLEFAVV